MSINRTAKGIVLVPCLLLGGAFLSAALWGAEPNRQLALVLGLSLLLVGILAQFLPDAPEPPPQN